MSKKVKISLLVTAIVLGVYFLNFALKDDVQEIEKRLHALDHPLTNIAHIELLTNNQAIAFYERGNEENLYFGSALFTKNLLGWKLVNSSTALLSREYKLDWSFSDLASHFSDYTDLISGKILDAQIEEVTVQTKSGTEFTANLIKYNDDEKFWFLVTNGEDLLGATITGLSSDGEIIEQITK